MKCKKSQINELNCFITGVARQGVYLFCRNFIKIGYLVHGVIMRNSSFNKGKIDYVINNKLYKNIFLAMKIFQIIPLNYIL